MATRMAGETVPGRSTTSVAGIVDDPATRARIIPESRRADGSVRKERRVKPGFTPAEDIGRFRPSRVLRAEAEAKEAEQHGGRRVPGYEPPAVAAARRAMASTTIAPSAAKPSDEEWRRGDVGIANGSSGRPPPKVAPASNGSWRSKAEVPDDWDDDEEVEKGGKSERVEETKAQASSNDTPIKSIDDRATTEEVTVDRDAQEEARKARALGKKIKAAQSLQERQHSTGEKLLPEQQAKVDQLSVMIRDLDALELSDEARRGIA